MRDLDNIQVNSTTTPTGGDILTRSRVVSNPVWRNILLFLMVFGPGLIVMEADNDAGAVSTYTQAGAQYGLHLLWVLLLLLPITYFCQEMVARLGIATGKGHAAMIYQRFGKWWGHFSLFDLQLLNLFTLVTEFAGISLALQRMGVVPQISVPTAAIGLIILVITGSYLRWERVTILLCLLDITWVVFSVLVHPGVEAVARNTFIPSVPRGGITTDLIFLVIAIVGTTIAPWQLFFQQSCVADKRLRFKDLKFARLDTFIGACFTVIVAGGMMIVGYVMYLHHLNYEDPAQMAVMIAPFMGNAVKNGVLLLMVNAAVLGATAVSLSSAWAYSEVRGWKNSLQIPFRSAPKFYLLYSAAVLLAASIVLIPNAPLQTIIIGVQVLAGLMLPSAIIFLQLLLNDKELLGEEFVNKRWNNTINWIIIIMLFILSIALAVQVMLPGLLPG
ncbi:MAG: Nramp family divalent metal transporter [Peptococcaceae bacterium]|jgi:Mn2+/Fe2+ NRAMP family transporter|nr:Nramp family divalent metal transporter [Peptococcaceae bacterium]